MAKRVLLLTKFPIRDDPRFKRHVRALQGSDDFELMTASPGRGLEGGIEHFEFDGNAEFLPRSATTVAALVTRAYSRVLKRSPLYLSIRERVLPARDSFDALLCSDLDLVPVSLELAAGREVFVDLREYYPQQLPEDIRWRLLVRPLLLHILRTFQGRWTGSITVSPGLVDLYQENFGFRPVLVTNASAGRQPRPRPTSDPVRLVFSGSGNPNRGLEVTIAAAAELPSLVFDLVVLSMPHHMKYRAKLEALAGQTSNVRVLPPVPAGELPTLHDQYDVGLCTFPVHSPQLNYGLPNKMFDYIQSGLAIVAGPGVHMASLVEEYEMGPVVDRFEEVSIRSALMELAPSRVDEWKSNTCAAAGDLDAEPSAERLRQLLRGGVESS